jgi:hypothetical protein
MPKGQKSCPNCDTMTGPRAYVCKNCNHIFSFNMTIKEKRTMKIVKDFRWQELQKGDKIKVGGGPYFFYEGELIPMGYRGKFVVEKVDDKGIHAWGLDKTTGFAHIYMGADYQNPETGVWKTKHKILKLKKKNPDDTKELIRGRK